jgi:hypothetical protein
MKKVTTIALVVLMVAVALVGTACAGETQSAKEEVILKGTVDANNRFIDESGQTYEMAANEQAAKIMEQPGQKVEIKGTVMEKEGVKTVVVKEFIALP